MLVIPLPIAVQVLELHLEYPRPLLPAAGRRYKRAAAEMAAFMHSRRLEPGEVRRPRIIAGFSAGFGTIRVRVCRAVALAPQPFLDHLFTLNFA